MILQTPGRGKIYEKKRFILYLFLAALACWILLPHLMYAYVYAVLALDDVVRGEGQQIVDLAEQPLIKLSLFDPYLIKAFENDRVSNVAAVIFLYKDPHPIKTLTEALKSPKHKTKILAAGILGEYRDKSAVVDLVNTLRTNDDEKLKCEIIRALSKIQDVRGCEAIIEITGEKSVVTRKMAIFSLRFFQNKISLDELKRRINDKDELIAITAIDSMRFMGGKEAFEALHNNLNCKRSANFKIKLIGAIGAFHDKTSIEKFRKYAKTESDAKITAQIKQTIDWIEKEGK